MKKYPKAFDDLYVNLVAAGETGGVLDSVLAEACSIHRKSDETEKES